MGQSVVDGSGWPGHEAEVFPRVETEILAAERPETAEDLTADRLLLRRHDAPARGWRRVVYTLSAHRLRPPESAAERWRRELRGRAEVAVAGGHHRVAVLSLKGGVGKTTTTVALGATLAEVRGDRVIAVDANPDRGTLADRVQRETNASVRDFLAERGRIGRYADARAFTSQASSRLEVLASDPDPAVSREFDAADYHAVAGILERFYSIALTDCGTGLLYSVTAGVLDLADQIVLVAAPSVDGARSASATLDWLDAHGRRDLVRDAVVVLSSVHGRARVDVDGIEAHFAGRTRAVVRIPYDPHLADGAEVVPGHLAPRTADSYLELAATVADRFPGR